MKKINDRVYLGMLAGLAGVLLQTSIDEISLRLGVSKRSYRTTAAGAWVSSRTQAERWQGQLLGFLMNIGLGMVGGIGMVQMLTKSGRDKLLPKGIFFGISFGGIITGLLSALPLNKVKPKDSSSNLSYVLANAAYGLLGTLFVAKLGDESLFDTKPQNNYLKPTNLTTEEEKHAVLKATK